MGSEKEVIFTHPLTPSAREGEQTSKIQKIPPPLRRGIKGVGIKKQKEQKMSKKTKISISIAIVLGVIIIAIVGIYNHFNLWQFKGVKVAYLQNYLQNPKCNFNLNQDVIYSTNSTNVANLDRRQGFIAHAGGALIDKKTGEVFTYTNSKEALLQSIKEGFRFIEIDLSLDAQGEIFAAHDYKHFYKITNALPKNFNENIFSHSAFAPPSKDYIKNAKIYGRFTPLQAHDINAIFSANPSRVYLVTDKLQDFDALSNQLDFGETSIKDRILIEVFSIKDYFKARKMGFKYPMFCAWDLIENIKMAMRHKIPMITTHTDILRDEQGAKLAEEYIKNGGCIFTFSSNETNFINEHLGKRVSAFYTDFYDIAQGECKLRNKDKCTTY